MFLHLLRVTIQNTVRQIDMQRYSAVQTEKTNQVIQEKKQDKFHQKKVSKPLGVEKLLPRKKIYPTFIRLYQKDGHSFGHSLIDSKKPSGQRQNRTADPLFFRQVLYRLSYLALSGDDGIRTRDLLRDRQA